MTRAVSGWSGRVSHLARSRRLSGEPVGVSPRRIQHARKSRFDARPLLAEAAALEDVGEPRRPVLGDGPRLRRRRRPLRLQGVGPPPQIGALLAVGRRQRSDDLVPRHLDEDVGLFRELLLFRRALGRVHGQGVAVGRFQLRLLGLAQPVADRRLNVGRLFAEGRDLRIQLFIEALILVALGRRGKVDLLGLSGAEKGLEAVVIGLGDGVELVIVAAGAADGEAEEGGADAVGHLGQQLLPQHGLVHVAAGLVDGAAAVEAGRDQMLGVRLASRVASAP